MFPTIDMIATGKNIENIRKNKNMAVKDIQTIFGFETPQAIYKWQRGAALPTVDNFIILATIFNTTIDNIIVTTSGT